MLLWPSYLFVGISAILSICGLARAVPQDIERAWGALKGAARPRIHVFLATSDIHLQYKLKMTREKCLEQARTAIQLAKSLCGDIEFSPEDATRTDINFLCDVLNAVVEAGATTLNIPDTVGYTVPQDLGAMMRAIGQQVRGVGKGVVLSTHCHNDLGLAVANSLAAVEAGARQIECAPTAVAGVGRRARNRQGDERRAVTDARQGDRDGLRRSRVHRCRDAGQRGHSRHEGSGHRGGAEFCVSFS